MSIRGAFQLLCSGKEITAVPFKLALDTTNAPTVVEGAEVIASAVTASGVVTITLREKFLAVMMLADLEAVTAVDLVPQVIPPVGSVSSGNGTVGVRLLAGATPTNPPAVGSNVTYLHGVLFFRSV